MRSAKTLCLSGMTFRCLYNKDEIQKRVVDVAKMLRPSFDESSNDTPLFICVLKGAFVFASDLVRAYGADCEIEFVRVSSYDGVQSSGTVRMFPGMDFEKIKGRRVIIVEDIIDTGLTMSYLVKNIKQFSPKSVEIVALCVKREVMCHDVNIDFCCFDIPNDFVVGYGLDYNGFYRNLPDLYIRTED